MTSGSRNGNTPAQVTRVAHTGVNFEETNLNAPGHVFLFQPIEFIMQLWFRSGPGGRRSLRGREESPGSAGQGGR